jgi:hypothetical protein
MQYANTLLNEYYEYKDKGLDYASNMEDIQKVLKVLAECVSGVDNNEKYVNLCKNNESALGNLGISYDESSKKVNFDAQPSIDATSFDELFNSNENSFYSKLSAYCTGDFENLMKLNNIGVSIDDYTVKLDERV